MSRAADVGQGPDRVRFEEAILLTKGEAFEACQALADADRFLLRAGQPATARALGDLFELLEQRLTTAGTGRQPPRGPRSLSADGEDQSASSWANSSDRELTQ